MFAKIANRFMEALSFTALEERLFSVIESKTPDELYTYMLKDEVLWDQANDEIQAMARTLAQKFSGKVDAMLDQAYVMERLRVKRPELWAIIVNSPNGLDWLNKQLASLRAGLL